jgi:hypothetical protein
VNKSELSKFRNLSHLIFLFNNIIIVVL